MEKFNSFINKKMSEEETDQFLREMLQKKLDKEQKAEWSQQLKEQYGVVRPGPVFSARKGGLLTLWRVAAAVLVMLSATIGFYLLRQEPTYIKLANDLIHRDKLAYADLRKGADDLTAERLKAVDAYQHDQYSAAIQHWTSLHSKAAFTTDDQFFLALSYLYDKKPSAALSAFEEHARRSNPGGRFEQERIYFSALALIKMNRLQEAKQKLFTLQATTQSVLLKERAGQLLEAIK